MAPQDPAEALAAVERSRREVHRRVGAGSWRYDLTYSAIIAGMIGSQALDTMFSGLGIAFGLLLLAVLYRSESDRLGIAFTGVTPRHARWVAVGLGLVLVALIVVLLVLKAKASPGTVALGAAGVMALAFVIALAASRLWLRVYRREHGIDR